MFVKFVKGYSLKNVRKKLMIVYLLNLTDVIFTLFLIRTGYFLEANFMMRSIIENITLSLIIKGMIPLLLILIVLIRIGKASEKQLYIANIIVLACVIYYVAINLSHIIWMFLYLLLKV